MRVPADLLLIGTGAALQHLSQDVQRTIHSKGITFEAMDTVGHPRLLGMLCPAAFGQDV